jgi:lipopolysaccharide transport system permease protein
VNRPARQESPGDGSWRIYGPDARRGLGLRQVWEARELLFFLAWRDFKVRYKQTVLGAAWAVLQPVLMMVVFTFIFGRLARVPSDGLPYPVFAYAGLLPWQLFAAALTESSNSLVANERLLTKTAFPRLVIPASAVGTSVADWAIGTLVLGGLLIGYGIMPAATVLLLPALVILAVGAALGLGLWLAALNVRYRDVRYVIPFIVQPLLFMTPVAYPAAMVPERWQALYSLNPMVGVVEGFRWAVFGNGAAPSGALVSSVAVTALLLVGGIQYFQRVERAFADFA